MKKIDRPVDRVDWSSNGSSRVSTRLVGGLGLGATTGHPKRRGLNLRSRLLGVVALTVLLTVGAAAPALADSHTQTVNLRVDGMVCPLCEQTVEAVVGDLPGIVTIEADYQTSTAVVTYEPAQVTPEEIVDRINTQTYYRARVTSEFIKTATFKIPGRKQRRSSRSIAPTTLVIRPGPLSGRR